MISEEVDGSGFPVSVHAVKLAGAETMDYFPAQVCKEPGKLDFQRSNCRSKFHSSEIKSYSSERMKFLSI